jgi:hypothetical protein
VSDVSKLRLMRGTVVSSDFYEVQGFCERGNGKAVMNGEDCAG